MDWKKLQNGSDIRGVALDGVEGEQVNLTPEVTSAVAGAFVAWLRKHGGPERPTVAVGRDSRLSGEALEQAFAQGAAQAGACVKLCGMATTPAMFQAIDGKGWAHGSVMITASHLPWNRNGLKFFGAQGGLDKADISFILEEAAKGSPDGGVAGEVVEADILSVYCDSLADYVRRATGMGDRPLEGMHVVVDAGNGAGGFFAERVLAPLGANTDGSRFLDPDGRFPNHVPNPEDPAAMEAICEAVRNSGADLGIIFDTDVDRAAIVDADASPINRNRLIALISSIVLAEHPGTTVVTDSVTSDGLARFISGRDGVHHRFKRGYKNVINEARRLIGQGQDCWIAIETSGHAALRENRFLDDGAFLAVKLLVEAARLRTKGQRLDSLIANLGEPAESRELRFAILADNFKEVGATVIEHVAEAAAGQQGWRLVEPNYEGVRVACEDEQGWFLLRSSLHDPVLPLNIESDIVGGVDRIRERVMGLLDSFPELELKK